MVIISSLSLFYKTLKSFCAWTLVTIWYNVKIIGGHIALSEHHLRDQQL